MYHLSDEQVDLIDRDLTRLGLTTTSVRANILDHLCIMIEQHISDNGKFEEAYQTLLPTFYRRELREIEMQTRLLLLSRDHLILTKMQFFALLFLMLAAPFVIYLLWAIPPEWAKGPYLIPMTIWGPVLAYASWPLFSLIVVFLIPDRLDPPIPKHARIALGLRSLISVIEQ